MSNNWQPTTSIETQRLRAFLLHKIRQFFFDRDITEVETPLLSQYTVTDVHIDSFACNYIQHDQKRTYYLQTSPEYAMKRLLSAGSGPIFQISKAFRNGEAGTQHNPEFTLLEWYRPGFNHHDLMQELDLLLQQVANWPTAEKITYQALFQQYLSIDPLNCTLTDLHNIIKTHQLMDNKNLESLDQDSCLQLLLSHFIEPKLGIEAPLFVYHFPASQAALAKINHDQNPPIAERFELYRNGVEIANGFHELTDGKEQQQRFQKDQQKRKQDNRLAPKIDQHFIQALQHGLPDCAGVAVGLDRLLMLITSTKNIKEVINFPWERA